MADTDNLVVLTFEGSGTAAAVYEQIEQMEKEKLLKVADAIIIERDEADALTPDEKVRVVQTHGKKGKYTRRGGGIGLLAGFLLGGPVGGLIVGAGLGALAALKDFGIDDKSIEGIKARLGPNTSALLVLGHADDQEALLAKLRTYDPQVVTTTLAPEVEAELRARLGSS